MNVTPRPTPNVLLCEDDDAHAHLIRRALFADSAPCDIIRCCDGEQTLAYLRREGRFRDAPRPDLVLLDLKLPRKPGLEVLAEVKQDPALIGIPVVILSTSNARQDRVRAAQLHANGYVVKPIDYDEFERAIGALRTYWCDVHEPAPGPELAEADDSNDRPRSEGVRGSAQDGRVCEPKPLGRGTKKASVSGGAR